MSVSSASLRGIGRRRNLSSETSSVRGGILETEAGAGAGGRSVTKEGALWLSLPAVAHL